jgi:glycosyltransferase involved in cell wall biosynthesis
VQLRDHCPRSAALLAAADAFILDSFFEGWSLASMEALAAGLPVVLSEVGGAQEQVGGGGCGFIVPNPGGDPLRVDWQAIRAARYRRQENQDAVVDAMEMLVEGQDHWAATRDELRAEARDRFSPSEWVQGHAGALLDTVRHPQRPASAPGEPVTP